MVKFKYTIALVSMGCILAGCEHQRAIDDGYVHEEANLKVEENRKIHFFDCSKDFNFSPKEIKAMEELLKETQGQGKTNVGFMIVSNKVIPQVTQEKVKKRIKELMYKYGFMDSRIVDCGVSVYGDAKNGVRIDILNYDVTEPDTSLWSEYIGDCDTNKSLPRYGTSDIYNLEKMIANEADLIAPRKYKGQDATTAITAMSSTGSSSSSSSSSSGSSSSSLGSSISSSL